MAAESETTAGQQWAQIIRDGASASGVSAIIRAINVETRSHRSNRADVIVACAQILSQSIVPGGPEVASEMRQGIIAMIDGYSMQVAVEGTK